MNNKLKDLIKLDQYILNNPQAKVYVIKSGDQYKIELNNKIYLTIDYKLLRTWILLNKSLTYKNNIKSLNI